MKPVHSILIAIFITGLMPEATSGEEVTLDSLQQSYELAMAEAEKPVTEFQQRYLEELGKLADEVQLAGKLEELLAVRKEIEGFRAGPIENLNRYPAIMKLRSIYDSSLPALESKALEAKALALDAYHSGVGSLVTELTSRGMIEEAVALNELKQRLGTQLAGIERGETPAAVASVETTAPGSASMFVDEVNTIPGLQGKTGRLRSFGTFTSGEELLPPEVADMDDFVKVYAYDRSWVGIREDGSAFIKYIRPHALTAHVVEERSVELISRGHDGWMMNRRNEFWRIAEPNHVFDVSKRPDGIEGCHCAGLVFWSDDGSLEAGGSQFGPDKRTPPPVGFFEGVIGSCSGSNTMIAVDPGGSLRAWEIEVGQPFLLDDYSGVLEIESGRDHSIIRKADGTVITFPIASGQRGWTSSMKTPDDLGGIPARVRAGGNGSVIQRTDGTWFSWGPNTALNAAVSGAGIAIDLDLYATSTGGYAIWIEALE